MKINSSLLLLSILACTTFISQGCKEKDKVQTRVKLELSPKPDKLHYRQGVFQLTRTTKVISELSNDDFVAATADLVKAIEKEVGLKLKASDIFTKRDIPSFISLTINKNANASYRIEISNNKILIEGSNVNSLNKGISTFKQILKQVNEQTTATKAYDIPALVIESKD